MDSLSKSFDDEREYDVILMNPPFKGAVDKGGVHPTLPSDTTKSELLFLHLILRALDMGGRAAVIVPDGVLFGSSRAHVEVRRRIIEENRLDGVVSMPSGVFKPYAGVSTAVLFFTRGAQTKDIWFYGMAADSVSWNVCACASKTLTSTTIRSLFVVAKAIMTASPSSPLTHP